jgi:hypothetical protein
MRLRAARDPGSGNYLQDIAADLYPNAEMGAGDIPAVASYPPANALWVFDSNIWGPRPATRDEFVAWPPRGYVPYQVVFARWSFAYPNADFSSASVTMNSGGTSVPLTQADVVDGYGENTLVWIPLGLNDGAIVKPASDTTYTINVRTPRSVTEPLSRAMVVFDPAP